MERPILLIIGFVWPEPNSSAAGVRMMQLIEGFSNNGYKVVFASAAQHSEFEFPLAKLEIETCSIKLNDDSFDEFLKGLNPTIVLFDRFMIEEQFGWRVSEILPNAIKILDTEDLHFLRKARHNAVKKGVEMSLAEMQTDIAKREIASILRCDLSLIISTYEFTLLTETFNISSKLLWYFPIWFEPKTEPFPTFEERKDFVFIGNFYHEPNRHAVIVLKEKIWPLIHKKLPEVNLNIYGAYCDEKLNSLHSEKDGFMVKGRAEQVELVMKSAKVCLAPMLFGAGLKGKLLEAMQAGTPSVTTSIGAEGIASNSDWPGFVSDDFNEFAYKACLLYSDITLWTESVQTGKKILENNFNRVRFEPNFFEGLKVLNLNLKVHRQGNFVGQILQHHTMVSTKYLSKYIMAKNKKSEDQIL